MDIRQEWRKFLTDIEQILVHINGFLRKILGFIHGLPIGLIFLTGVVFIVAVAAIVYCHITSIWHNKGIWKKKIDSNLMYSYFCGSGQLQRSLAYAEAYALLYDYRWCPFSFAGIAYRIQNFEVTSRVRDFFYTMLSIPIAVLGAGEMFIRYIVGTVYLFLMSIIHGLLLLCIRIVSKILRPLLRMLDKKMRVRQNCSTCYTEIDLPRFLCPSCGSRHSTLIPGSTGNLFARCKCGKFLPVLAITGRSGLEALCPKCEMPLPAANAKQFSIQLIGGNATGKTAFLASFQHMYLGVNSTVSKIVGRPSDKFEYLEKIYRSGVTEPSSPSETGVYNFIHHADNNVKQENLAFYDIPDEVILSDTYGRNPIHFGYANGIILMIDPLSSSEVRKECLRNGDAIQYNYSEDDVEDLIVQFVQQFSRMIGRDAKRMIEIPIAVVINKADIKSVKREIGFPKIKVKYNANVEKYDHDINNAINEVCRDYLLKIGMSNAVNNLESVFTNVRYFSVSAMGHSSEQGRAFEPVRVMDPVTWIGNIANAEMKELLEKAQNTSD